VKGSLHLFNGVEGLCSCVASECAALGMQSALALSPTPLAALVAARCGQPVASGFATGAPATGKGATGAPVTSKRAAGPPVTGELAAGTPAPGQPFIVLGLAPLV